MKRVPTPVGVSPSMTPTRKTNPLPSKCDASRRRFLRQLAGGAGVCMVGYPQVVNGASLPIDLSKLSHHPRVDELTQDENRRDPDAAPPSDLPGESPAPSVQFISLEESRALWVEPSYLLLIRWSRPEEDESPIAALEAAEEQIGEFLATRVTTVDDLHNLDLLHQIEVEIVDLLAPIILPAEIEVLHLDHDCTRICHNLDPSLTYPEDPMMVGYFKPAGWK